MSASPTRPGLDLDDPGFTPGAAHFDALLAALESATREEAPRLERVLARGGERALAFILERLPSAPRPARASLVNVLGRLADPRAGALLREALSDGDERIARRAASALGKLPDAPENAAALGAIWDTAGPGLRRAVAVALGKIGGPEAAALLASAPPGDPELARIMGRARLLLERRASRGGASGIDTGRALGVMLPVAVECRAGLSQLLAEELAPLGAVRVLSPSLCELPFSGRLTELFVARTALGFGVRVPLARGETDLARAVGKALASADARAAFGAWTDGQVRFRLAFSEGGHQRALVFRIAEAASEVAPELVNEPRSPNWEVVVVRRAEQPHLVLAPLGFDDPRFAYRRRDVRAASHPTVAAALARSAGVVPSDVVWDPFVGSALELVERARLGPYRSLLGSDTDPGALDAARENLRAAGVAADLRLGDATRLEPQGVSLILTNPPMGRRLVRDRTLADLLDAFVAHASRVLVRGGRLVWLSPVPARTHAAARHAGFRVTRGPLVDLGGFEVELQAFQRR